MKIARYTYNGKTSIGLVRDQLITNIDALLPNADLVDVGTLLGNPKRWLPPARWGSTITTVLR